MTSKAKNKGKLVDLDNDLLGSLDLNQSPAPDAPVQKVVPVAISTREGKTIVNFWADKRLHKTIKGLAIQEDVDMADLYIEAAKTLLQGRGYVEQPDGRWQK